MTPFTRRRKITLAAAILPVPPGNQKAAFGATFGSFQRNAKLWLIILIPLYSCGNTFVKFIQSIHEAVEVGGIAPPDSWMISQNPHYGIPTAPVFYHDPIVNQTS